MRVSVLAILLMAAGVVRADTSHSAATAASGTVRFVYGDGDRELFADNSSVAVSRARRALAVYSSNGSNASDNEAGGTFEVVSLDTLRAIPFHLPLGPYPNEAVRAGRYEAVNRQLARNGFVLPTEYETASGDDLSDEIQERFRDEAHSTVRCGTEICPESAVVRFPRSRLTVCESGRVFLDGHLVSIGKKYGELLLGAVRWWGVYLPREGVVVVWSDRQTHDGGSATLVRRVRPPR